MLSDIVQDMTNKEGGKPPVQRGDSAAKEWAHIRAGEFGNAVQFWRKKLQLTAVDLSNRTKEIGYPITRATIAKIESNQRNSKVDFAEVVVLAAALEVVPADLVFWGRPDKKIALTPRTELTSEESTAWLYGGEAYQPFANLHNPRIEQSSRLRLAVEEYRQVVEFFEQRHTVHWSETNDVYFITDPSAGKKADSYESKTFANELLQIEEFWARVSKLGGNVDLPLWWANHCVVPF